MAVIAFPGQAICNWCGLYYDFYAARDDCYSGKAAHFATLNHSEAFTREHWYHDPFHDQLNNCTYLTTNDPPGIFDSQAKLDSLNTEYNLLGLSHHVFSGMLYYRQEYFFFTTSLVMAVMFFFYIIRSGGGIQPVYATFTFTFSLLSVLFILAKVCLRRPSLQFSC